MNICLAPDAGGLVSYFDGVAGKRGLCLKNRFYALRGLVEIFCFCANENGAEFFIQAGDML